MSEPVFPLGLAADRATFKLHMNDVGLLAYRLAGNLAVELLAGRDNMNFGSIYENYVAQELCARGFELFYYNSTKRGEVDFVVQSLSRGSVSLIEVKSGKDYKRHRALENLLKIEEYETNCAYVLCNGNVDQAGKVLYLPIYMTMFLES